LKLTLVAAVAGASASESGEGILISCIKDRFVASAASAAASSATLTATSATVGTTTGFSWCALTIVSVEIFVLGLESHELCTRTSGDGVNVSAGDCGLDRLNKGLLNLVLFKTLLVHLLMLSDLGIA